MSRIKYLCFAVLFPSIIALNAQSFRRANKNFTVRKSSKTIHKRTIIPNYDPNVFLHAHSIVPAHRNCGTMEEDSIMRAKFPQLGTFSDFENWVSQKVVQYKKNHQDKSSTYTVYTIPIIFHIINNGESEGTGTNISQAQIQSQVTVLNEDYRRLNADTTNTPAPFQSAATDCDIEFCLAMVDTNGNTLSEPGIDRIDRNGMGWSAPPYSMNYLDNTIKPATYWQPDNYFNVWVCNLGGGLLGYTQFPNQSGLPGLGTNNGPASTDGVVITYYSVGRPPYNPFNTAYNLGRTLTHEAGHFFGLRHTWGDDGGACSGSDYCADTPNQANMNYGAPSFPLTDACSGSYPGVMFMNYMDYVDDNSMNEFTSDQKVRMMAVLVNSPRRIQLTSSNVCSATGVPGCGFTSNVTTVAVGGSVQFTDMSSGGATSWSWSFPGGTPATSTAQNPTVTYNTPGTYNVILSACNANGCCYDTVLNYINVVTALGCDTLNFPPPGTLTVYSAGTPPAWGYLAGWNSYGDSAKADQFSGFSPLTTVTGGLIYFYGIHDAGNGAQVQLNVWDNTGAAGSPGNILASETVSLYFLDTLFASGQGILQFLYPNPVTVTSTYYMGIKMLGFGAGDSLGMVSNTNGNSPANMMWEENAGGVWGDFPTNWGGTTLDLFISPFMTDIPAQAVITASDTTICQGDSIYFNSSASQNVDSLAWTFQNGSLSGSNDSALYITYSSAGTFYVILNAVGNCSSFSSDTLYITVLPRPNVNITNNNVLCNGDSTGSAIANVAGGTSPYSYFWNTSPTQTNDTATNLPAGNYTVTVTDSNGCISTANTIITEPTALNLVGNTIGASCGNNDGKAFVTVSGGTPVYSYAWNTIPVQTTDTASNLPAGTYQVVVTDNNGCKDSVSLVVGGGGNYLITTVGDSDETCFGIDNGKAWVSVTGTTNPISYSWSTVPVQTTDTATGLGQGTYYITVTDIVTGCSKIDTVTVSGPSTILLSTSSQAAVCANDSNGYIAVSATGGVFPYTYQWKNNLNITVSTNDTLLNQPPGIYTAYITDANGCIDSIIDTIANPAPVAVTIIGTDSVNCFGENNGQAFSAASGGTGSLSFSWNTVPVQNNDTASNLTAGIYTVTVTDANGCTDTAIANVYQPAVLNVTISSSSNASCFGSSDGQALSQPTGGTNPYTYLWNTIPPQTAGGATNLTAGTYQVIVTDAHGCQDSTTVTITQPTQIQISFSTATENCGAGNGSATATASAGFGSGYSYLWSTGSTSTTINSLSSGWYSVTVTDGSGCTRLDSVFVPNSSGTLSSTISMTPELCNGDSNGTATVTPSGGTGTYTYIWNTTPVQTNQTATNVPAGTYIVVVTNNGCTLNDTITVTAPSALSLIGSAVSSICTNNNGEAIISASGGTPGYSYLWNTTPAQTNDTASNLFAGVYQVIVTDNNGCQDSVNVTVNNNIVNITSNVTGFDATCNGVSNGSAVVVPTNGTAPYNYSWNSVPSQNNDTAFALDSGLYTVTIIDSNGCVGTNSILISQPTPIIINLIPNNPSNSATCDGSILATVSGGTPAANGYSSLWTPSNQTGVSDTAACVGLNCLTITDSLGCTAQSCVTLTAPPPCNLVGTIITDSVSCFGGSDGMAIVNTSGGYGALTYQWNDTNNQTTDTAFGLPAGVYQVVVIDTMGCSVKITDTVYQPEPIATYLSITNAICAKDSNGSVLIDSVTGGTPSYTYLWSYNNETGTAIDSLPTGNYTVIITDANGCMDSTTAQINSSININITANVSNATCKLSDGKISININGGNPPYTQQWIDADSASIPMPTNNLKAGDYTVYVVDSNGCEDSSTIKVGMNNPLVVKGDVTNEECKGFENGAIDATASNGTQPYSYLWSTGADTKNINGLGNGDYTVTVVDAIGCVIQEIFHVGLKDNGCINIPNAFTPNGDGDNDTWILRGSISYPQMHVQIFNRWGLKIFDSIGYQAPWDGTYSGKKVSAATYYYVINLGPKLETLTGSVTIVR